MSIRNPSLTSHHYRANTLPILAQLCLFIAAANVCFSVIAASDPQLGRDERSVWISNMKTSERGPFSRIRWFCADGAVLPPKPYGCGERGGGFQHGEWSADTKALRADGYAIANIYADLTKETKAAIQAGDPIFAQMLIEQFLITADDGWILRKARFYRGAYQDEDERKGSRELLLSLVRDSDWIGYRYRVLHTAARFLDHGAETASIQEIRQLSAALSDENPDFKTLRAKIHGHPEADDANAVREFANRLSDNAAPYHKLANLIDDVYAIDVAEAIRKLGRMSLPSPVISVLELAAKELMDDNSALNRMRVASNTMAQMRELLPIVSSSSHRLSMVDLNLILESEYFTAANQLESDLAKFSRQERLSLVNASISALFGSGLISKRQQNAAMAELQNLESTPVSAKTYKASLDYLSLLPSWGTQNSRLFFGQAMDKLSRIEPKANLFIQDLLRGSPMFFYASLIDGLVRDANQIIGVRNELFGDNVGAGLRSLNPGIAHGELGLADADNTATLHKQGIYLLPETVSELPPIAGILTEGEGNPLSHVQLLARNLGIPNVGVDQSLLPRVRERRGRQVLLAVSPAGSVRLTDADDHWAQSYIESKKEPVKTLIRVELAKLDLDSKNFATLSELRASDSGRTVGPKAAKLGELKHFYPEAVAEGLAIPFGVFRELLETTRHTSGVSLFDWMRQQYKQLAALPAELQDDETEAFRSELEAAIAAADPGVEFKARLTTKLAQVFGPDKSYGVFVRSDTNVEDLPGFTGAGLNLTVANVVGTQNIIEAISRVWASPFTARSFAWRQSLMDKPEHVYPAVLLMLSVNADKSGVLVTQDIDSGDQNWLSVAINEGVGGAVDGQSAESLRINLTSGETRLTAAATAPIRRQVNPNGGVDKLPVSNRDRVLSDEDIAKLIVFAKELPHRFPAIVDAAGRSAPADIEFGFLDGELRLFQIRPFLDSDEAQENVLLQSLDAPLLENAQTIVPLDELINLE